MSYDTYIINLKQDTDKYARMKIRLQNIGLKHTRFDAINGKYIKDRYDDLIMNKEFIPRSTIGCALSHYIVCNEHFKHDKGKIAMILEDDAVPLFKNIKDIDNIIKDAPKDWEIILLYTQGVTNYRDNSWECKKLSGSTMAYLINYKGFKKRYDNYKVYTHTDFERCLSQCKIYKTPTIYFRPEFSESSTSSKTYKYMTPLYDFIDKLYYDELETEITGFTASMLSRYKLVRIPHLELELDLLEIIFIICIFFSIIAIMISKNKFSTSIDCIIYSFGFTAFIFSCLKIYANILY